MKTLFVCLFLLTLISCSDDVKEPTPGTPPVSPGTCSSTISFANDISPIITQNCAISGCHNGSVSPDLRSYSGIASNKNGIRTQTSQRTMPVGRTLTQNQIDAISCWVQQGGLNN